MGKHRYTRMSGPPADVLAARVQQAGSSDCWPFTGPHRGGTHPYGAIHLPGTRRSVLAHRLAYEIAFGPIPSGLFVLHHCDNPPCCNPAHLFVGTQKDNLRDMSQKGRHFSRTKPERLARGERNGQRTHPERTARGERARHKLTELQVKAIRNRLAGGESGRALAREYGLDKRTIYRIRDGMSWGWL
jgi:hypothetical protein